MQPIWYFTLRRHLEIFRKCAVEFQVFPAPHAAHRGAQHCTLVQLLAWWCSTCLVSECYCSETAESGLQIYVRNYSSHLFLP